MKRKFTLYFVLFMSFILNSCTSFILEKDIPLIEHYEKYRYVMKKDIVLEKFSLTRGTTVKILINYGEEWIKVYGYSIQKDLLRSDRVLILYLFTEDFPGGKFDVNIFEKKLYEVVTRK